MNIPFEPMALPFNLEYVDLNEIVSDIAVASTKLGEFNEMMEHSKIAYTYSVNHMIRIESLYSTKIEGTQTTIDAVYESDTEKEETKNPDIKEVLRYNEALSMASKEINDNPITIKLLKRIHEILLRGDVRKNSRFIPGEFRTQQNRVGDHVPPIAANVPQWMGNLERYINNDYQFEDKLPAIVKAALIHAQFETIHPFPDGNGRVGRVLIPIYLFKQGVVSSPFFFLSQELERNRVKYYSFLQGTRSLTVKGFTDWIKFFLNSVINQVNRDIVFLNSLDRLYESTLCTMRNNINTTNSEIVIRAIFKHPIFTIDMLNRETGINKNSLRKYVNILKKENVIFKDQNSRNSRFYFIELLDLL